MKKFYFFSVSVVCSVFFLFSGQLFAQINIMPGPAVTPVMMVENIVGEGITFDNVSFQGANVARGIFTNGQTTNLGISSGIFLCSGAGYNIPGPNNSGSAGTNNGMPGHPLLTAITTTTTYDAAVLTFDFVPESDTMRFKYVFGSEEYHEWVGSSYNDVFGYFVSGPNPMGGSYNNKNIAIIPGTANTSVSINNVNNGPTNNGPCMNCAYFNNNVGGLTLQYDGKTTVLIAWVLVVPCETYTIRIGVADAGDGIYDTGVFIEENSFESPKISVELEPYPAGVSETMIEGCVSAEVIFTLPDPSYAPVTICFEIGGTALNGIDYEYIDDCVTFEEGSDTAVINVVPLKDGIIEGDETIILIIENILGCIVRYDTITFIISDYIDMVSVASPNTMICAGAEIQIWVQVYNGIPTYTYEWDGFDIDNDTITVSPDTTTWYFVNVMDMCLDTITDSIKVTVFPIPEVDLGPDTAYICEGDTLVLDAGPNGILGYFWQNGSGGQTFNVTQEGFYFVTIFGAGGCPNSDSIHVFQTVIDIDIGPDTAICVGESVVFTAPDGFDAYQWQNGSTGQSITATETGHYWVKVTLNGCTEIDSVYLFVDDPNVGISLGPNQTVCKGTAVLLKPISGIYNTYLWSTGDTTSSIIVTEPGTYTLYVSSGCGEAQASVTISNFPVPTPSLGNDLNLCYGQSALLNPGNYLSYKWQDNTTNPFYTVTQAGTYHVTVTDINGCTGSDTIFVQIGSIVNLGVGDTLLLCGDETITLTAQGDQFDFYTWSNGEYGTNTITIDDGGWYTIQVNYFYGCPSSDSVYVDAHPIPEAIISGEDMLCDGDTIWLYAPVGDYKYAWNNQQTNEPSYMVAQGGNITLKMSNVCGEDYDTKTVTLNSLPNVYLGEDQLLFPGESVTLDAGSFVTYVWNGNPNLDGQFLTISYDDINKKDSVWVEVFDGYCKNTDLVVIEIFDVDVPIVITPNGDGINDRFEPGEGWSGVQQHKMMVFNRWGEKIWESSNFTSGWDGKHNGRLVAEGTYFWVLEVFYGPNSTKKIYKGSLTVIGSGS